MNDIGEKLLESLGTPLLKDLEEAGLTKKKLIEKLSEELEATEEKPFNYNGTISYSKPLPNWEIRQKARIDIQKLCAFYPKDMVGIPEEGLSINVINYARAITKEIQKGEEVTQEPEAAIKSERTKKCGG